MSIHKTSAIILIFLTIFIGHSLAQQSSVKIDLRNGWNSISVPYKDLSIIKNDCSIKSIYHFNAIYKKYEKLEKLENAKPGLGYWVYAAIGCNLTFSGTQAVEISDLGDGFNGSLKTVWNQIGSTSQIMDILDNSGDCELKYFYIYSNEKKIFEKSYLLEPGNAYWIYAKNNCTLGSYALGPIPEINTQINIIENPKDDT